MKSSNPPARPPRWTAIALVLLAASAAARTAPSRVVAIGDVHGAYGELTAILREAELVDGRLAWAGGTATLIQTGDVVDRGPKQRECLDLLMELQRQAPRAGGAVIALIGNHEVMNVFGDVRYLSADTFRTFAGTDAEKRREDALKDYVKFLTAHAGHGHEAAPPADDEARKKWMEQHPVGFFEHRDAFAPDGQYGKWIRSNHAVVQVGDGVFVHGGLNPALEFKSVRELDERVTADFPAFDAMWKELVNAKMVWRYMTFAEAVRFAAEEVAWRQAEGPVGELPARTAVLRLLAYRTWVTLSADGPLWYRGLATEPEEKLEASLTAMLGRLNASYLVAGHSVVAGKQVTTRFGSRVFLIDTGMLEEVYAGRASALEIQDGRFTAHQVNVQPKPLPAPGGSKINPPAG